MIRRTLSIVALCLVITALVAQAARGKQPEPDEDPIPLESLKQVCANENGGHLNEHLIEANYIKFLAIFESNERIDALLRGSYDKFTNAVKAQKGKKGSVALTNVLKEHTSRLCGMLEAMTDIVRQSS